LCHSLARWDGNSKNPVVDSHAQKLNKDNFTYDASTVIGELSTQGTKRGSLSQTILDVGHFEDQTIRP
jgi:hypothetical protein